MLKKIGVKIIFYINIWGPDQNQLIGTTNSWFRGVNFGNHATSPIIFNGRVRVAKKVAAALVWSRLVNWYISCGHLCVWVFSKLWRPLVPKPMVRFGPDFFSRMDYSHLLVVQFSSHSAQRFQSYRGVSHPKYSYSTSYVSGVPRVLKSYDSLSCELFSHCLLLPTITKN